MEMRFLRARYLREYPEGKRSGYAWLECYGEIWVTVDHVTIFSSGL
jgi:hypothetical protein